VVDGGNGVAGPLAVQLLDSLGCSVTPLYVDIDGNFPNHHPDPGNPDNLEDLIDNVQRNGADLGIAFDGDGDRIGVVTPSGKIIWPDRLLMLLAKDLLSRNPGADILYDVKCTRDVAELVVEILKMVDIDQQQTHRTAALDRILDDAAAVRLEPSAVEYAGQRVAAAARQQVLITFARRAFVGRRFAVLAAIFEEPFDVLFS